VNEKKDERVLYLKGPQSPLETYAKPVIRMEKQKRSIQVRVERESINYVLLDDNSDIEADRLLVAADISKNNDYLKLRNTTLFPKIKGLFSLCCMLFCPTLEFRYKFICSFVS
jgi:hypothetical protein